MLSQNISLLYMTWEDPISYVITLSLLKFLSFSTTQSMQLPLSPIFLRSSGNSVLLPLFLPLLGILFSQSVFPYLVPSCFRSQLKMLLFREASLFSLSKQVLFPIFYLTAPSQSVSVTYRALSLLLWTLSFRRTVWLSIVSQVPSPLPGRVVLIEHLLNKW